MKEGWIERGCSKSRDERSVHEKGGPEKEKLSPA